MKLEALYKRSTTGKISFWEIEVEENKFRTISGFTDGLKVTSEWTICEKKTYCTAEEQALKQAKAIHKKKIELGAFENIEKIDDPILFKPMLANDYDDYKDKVKFPIASQPKLDGVRCICTSKGMFSRNGKEIISALHITNSLKPLFDLYPDLILDGELYCDKLSNDFNKIISCVRKTKPTQEDLDESEKFIEYWVYDCPNWDNLDHTFIERYEALIKELSISQYKFIKIVPVFPLSNAQEVPKQFHQYIGEGYEGQMLRVMDSLYENKRSKSLLKHKEFQTEEFIILSVTEGIGKLQNKAGTVQIKTKDGIEVDVTINGTHEFLADLWVRKDELIGREATVRYFGYTTDKSLRFPKVIDIDRWKFE
jgi:DNA ligase-1